MEPYLSPQAPQFHGHLSVREGHGLQSQNRCLTAPSPVPSLDPGVLSTSLGPALGSPAVTMKEGAHPSSLGLAFRGRIKPLDHSQRAGSPHARGKDTVSAAPGLSPSPVLSPVLPPTPSCSLVGSHLPPPRSLLWLCHLPGTPSPPFSFPQVALLRPS